MRHLLSASLLVTLVASATGFPGVARVAVADQAAAAQYVLAMEGMT
jgi:hypothetical protein